MEGGGGWTRDNSRRRRLCPLRAVSSLTLFSRHLRQEGGAVARPPVIVEVDNYSMHPNLFRREAGC